MTAKGQRKKGNLKRTAAGTGRGPAWWATLRRLRREARAARPK